MKIEVCIPFSGFYQSIHDHQLDRHIEMILDDNENLEFDDLEIDGIGFSQEYAKRYASAWMDYREIDGEFVELDSPREYNFRTDYLVIEVTLCKAEKLAREYDEYIDFHTISGKPMLFLANFVDQDEEDHIIDHYNLYEVGLEFVEYPDDQ